MLDADWLGSGLVSVDLQSHSKSDIGGVCDRDELEPGWDVGSPEPTSVFGQIEALCPIIIPISSCHGPSFSVSLPDWAL